MERAEFLKRMRSLAEALYDHCAPRFWTEWGFYDEEAHRKYLAKFFALIDQQNLAHQPVILSAACGAGRYDGLLMEAGYSVVGTDQSAGVLAQAREHFPRLDTDRPALVGQLYSRAVAADVKLTLLAMDAISSFSLAPLRLSLIVGMLGFFRFKRWL